MIHAYQLNGYNIVLDVYSGSVHAVDELAYDAIRLLDAGTPREEISARLCKKYEASPQDVADVFADIDELTAQGKLFAPDTYAGHAFDFKNRSNVVKALCLHVAHTCNLNCSYCFASQGKYHGERAVMSFEVGKRALDFLIENSGNRRNLEVDFFGGEPLMKKKDLMAQTGITGTTIAKMGRGEPVNLEVIGRICGALHVNVGDVVDFKE